MVKMAKEVPEVKVMLKIILIDIITNQVMFDSHNFSNFPM